MVFPLYDDNTDRRLFPFVNYALIALNIIVFVAFQRIDPDNNPAGKRFTLAFATVPYEIATGKDLDKPEEIKPSGSRETFKIEHQPTPISVYITLITSMFLHGSLLHLLGNMLFLWIFGDNVEDSLGHVRYIFFYLLCGVIASLAHVGAVYAFGGNTYIPSLGASGAISGVLGGYILMHPHRRVTVLLFRFLTQVSAWVAIGIWFLFQLISGLADMGGELGGVAYGAHIGGFVAGLGLIKVFALGITPEVLDQRAINRSRPRRPFTQ